MPTPSSATGIVGPWLPTLSWWALVGVAAKLGEWLPMIVCALKRWVCWLLQLPLNWWFDFFMDILDTIPEEPPAGWNGVVMYYRIIDTYLPLTEGTALWGALVAFLIPVIILRNIMRFIPAMS